MFVSMDIISTPHLVCMLSRSALSDPLWPSGLWPTRLLCPWDFPGKTTGSFFPSPWDLPSPGIEPTSLCLQQWPSDSSPLHHLESSNSSPYSPVCVFSLIFSSPGSLSVWEHTSLPYSLANHTINIKESVALGFLPKFLFSPNTRGLSKEDISAFAKV